MEFNQLAKERYSCRELADREVPSELIDRIIETGRLAPTAVNRQPYKIFRLEGKSAKENLDKVTRFTFGAKKFLVVGYDPDAAWVRRFDGTNFGAVDAAIVATHMMMEITDLGLASTWVGHFDAPLLKQIYPQMEKYELIAIFPLGYAAKNAVPSERHADRKPLDELVEVL